ncbi:MinD/ParA family protein [Petralouisia muris]|uniref:MinD/ParA family protein n=1 Tax=Petralouisia muris TaxID=3032872 RepID=A0AC61RY23_9FIRM|nr:MinD/ParA family protein [Petralouisia muris]TGY96826.1 MinD/ParA family protein [Petralouisia muris]
MDQAEQLRNIVKKNQQWSTSKARIFTVTSGKGGVGKSNVVVNLAVHMQRLGKKVIIFDADLGLANVEIMFGAIPKYNLSDLIYRGKTIQEIITPGPMDIGFISGGSGITGVNNLSKEKLKFLVHNLSELDGLADIILIDTGAGISDHVLEFVMASPEILLLATSEPSSLTDAYSLLKALHRNPEFRQAQTKIKVISNRVVTEEEGMGIYEKLNAVVGQFLKGNLEYLGMIPQDAAMEKAVRQQQPVSILYPEAKSSRAFEVLTGNLLDGNTVPLYAKKGIMQLLSRFIYKRG